MGHSGGAAAPAAELCAVARRFGPRWVLRGVSLRVERGEAVGVVGRNGSGKTTLLRILATALRPTRGSGWVWGHDLVEEAARVREVVGMLAHEPGVYDDLTAAENLRFALRMAGLPADGRAIAEVLEAVGLAREAGERVRGFSAGMRRRLALARLLARRPRVLLLDEPYASFDAAGVQVVNELARRTRDGGGAVVVATHDVARALGTLDRLLRLDDGRLAPIEPEEALALTGSELGRPAERPG